MDDDKVINRLWLFVGALCVFMVGLTLGAVITGLANEPRRVIITHESEVPTTPSTKFLPVTPAR